MKTITIETKKDIKTENGILIPKGSILKERNHQGYIITKNTNGGFRATPYSYEIYHFVQYQALEDGSEKKVTEDKLKVFKMFSRENGRYMTQFETETIEEAEGLASEFIKSSNINDDYSYNIRE